jgi:ribonucleotide reductase beta subunit family protein with ferritin-like domain
MATAVSAESRYFQLYSRAKRLAWDPAAIDLTPDVAHWAMLQRDYPVEQHAEQIHRRCSLFWEGEGSVTRPLGPILSAMPHAGLRAALVEGVTRYLGVVEAMLARTGYQGVGEALARRGWLPGLQEGFRLIRRDEGRYVSHGVHFVREMVAADPAGAEIVQATPDCHLPRGIATVQLFDYPHPITPVEPLVEYAREAARWFLSAAGLGEDDLDVGDLEDA